MCDVRENSANKNESVLTGAHLSIKVASSTAMSLFIADWCFLGLGICKIEMREEGAQVGGGKAVGKKG